MLETIKNAFSSVASAVSTGVSTLWSYCPSRGNVLLMGSGVVILGVSAGITIPVLGAYASAFAAKMLTAEALGYASSIGLIVSGGIFCVGAYKWYREDLAATPNNQPKTIENDIRDLKCGVESLHQNVDGLTAYNHFMDNKFSALTKGQEEMKRNQKKIIKVNNSMLLEISAQNAEQLLSDFSDDEEPQAQPAPQSVASNDAGLFVNNGLRRRENHGDKNKRNLKFQIEK